MADAKPSTDNEGISRRTLGTCATASTVALVALSGGYWALTRDDADPEPVALQTEENPRVRIASLDDIGDQPFDFAYPLGDHSNFLVRQTEHDVIRN